jgi:beta-N-acetylhexosaminidase
MPNRLAVAAWLGLAMFGLAAAPSGDLAEDLLARMTPEQRVGQLFLVTFRGSSLNEDNPIYSLIREYYIGGVVLRAEEDNFVGPPDTVTTARALVRALQAAAFQASADSAGAIDHVPLLIGIAREGNGPPYSTIMSGLSELPSQMAIGASWDPAHARLVGEAAGAELESLGFNLFLGPSLDVLEDPTQLAFADLGVRTFGGDAYWVSVMGRAFIEGVHSGSQGRLAVIPQHFPGLGGSDRPIREQISTVRKSLVQLQQIELEPFFAVTGAAPGSDLAVADGLLVGHIRYQGFQGNIRDTTRPIGLDPDAFGQLMSLEPFQAWRQAGGVTLSDELGSPALRRFYASVGQSFRGHLTARDAFLAGNDLLYLSEFRADTDPDQATTVRNTLSFFSEKYRDDPLFAQRVDEAVLRILRLKLRLYDGEFGPPEPVAEGAEDTVVGAGSEIALEVARVSATLLDPPTAELQTLIAAPPQIGERIVFMTDVRTYRQCSTCDPIEGIGRTALEAKVLALYGTRAAGQVGAWNLTSLSMADLARFLGQSPPGVPAVPLVPVEEVDAIIRQADWLVFVTLKNDPSVFGSGALKLLLDTRPELVRNKNVVVFAMDVPYDLGPTDISKLDLYYALYGKSSGFIEMAARLLFQEVPAVGAPPVTVPGIGYDLIEITSPDPDQLISLAIQSGEAGTPTVPGYSVGDTVVVRSGLILDHNGHPVPDRTPVEFVVTYQEEGITTSLEATTLDGFASVAFTLDRLGTLNIAARSEPANLSEILQLNVQEGIVTIITPTLEPTATPEPTVTPEPIAVTPTVEGEAESSSDTSRPSVGLGELVVSLAGIAGLASVGHRFFARKGLGSVRAALLIAIGGLLVYDYLALGLPGSAGLLRSGGAAGAAIVTWLGALAGAGGAYWWMRRLAGGGQQGD